MKKATREQSLAARTLESASAPGWGKKDYVRNHPRFWPFPQVLSAAPAPGAALVVFPRTPRELLTAEQNSEPSVPRIFPTLFYATTVAFGFLCKFLLFVFITRC